MNICINSPPSTMLRRAITLLISLNLTSERIINILITLELHVKAFTPWRTIFSSLSLSTARNIKSLRRKKLLQTTPSSFTPTPGLRD